MTGQTVYLTAVATQPMRYIAVEREVLRPLLFEDGPLGDVLLSAFIARREALQQHQGIGVEIVGPRSSAATRRDGRLRAARAPAATRGATPSTTTIPRRRRWSRRSRRRSCRSCACRAGPSCAGRAAARSGARSGIGAELGAREEVDLRRGRRRARPGSAPRSTARPRASTRSSSRARCSAARPASRGGSRTTSASRPGISGAELTSPRRHAGAQVRRADGHAVPRRSRSSRAPTATSCGSTAGGDRRARRRARHRRRVPPPAGRRPRRLRGHQRLLRRRPARGAALRRDARRRRRRRQLGRPGRDLARRAAARS